MECEAAGFDGHLTTPLRQEHLAELCARARAYAALAAPPPAADG